MFDTQIASEIATSGTTPDRWPHRERGVTCKGYIRSLDIAIHICRMHIGYGRESHEQQRRAGAREAKRRARVSWGRGAAEELAGTCDSTLSQGVELLRVRAHGAGFGLRVRGDEPWDALQDAAADGERGHRRVQLGDLEGWAGSQDVHHHGYWQVLPRLLGQVAGAVPTNHGQLLPAVHGQAAREQAGRRE